MPKPIQTTTTPQGTRLTLASTSTGQAHVTAHKKDGTAWVSRTRPTAQAAKEYWRINRAANKKGGNNNG